MACGVSFLVAALGAFIRLGQQPRHRRETVGRRRAGQSRTLPCLARCDRRDGGPPTDGRRPGADGQERGRAHPAAGLGAGAAGGRPRDGPRAQRKREDRWHRRAAGGTAGPPVGAAAGGAPAAQAGTDARPAGMTPERGAPSPAATRSGTAEGAVGSGCRSEPAAVAAAWSCAQQWLRSRSGKRTGSSASTVNGMRAQCSHGCPWIRSVLVRSSTSALKANASEAGRSKVSRASTRPSATAATSSPSSRPTTAPVRRAGVNEGRAPAR